VAQKTSAFGGGTISRISLQRGEKTTWWTLHWRRGILHLNLRVRGKKLRVKKGDGTAEGENTDPKGRLVSR